MTAAGAQSVAGSYRDPAGGVHRLGSRVLIVSTTPAPGDSFATLAVGPLEVAQAERLWSALEGKRGLATPLRFAEHSSAIV